MNEGILAVEVQEARSTLPTCAGLICSRSSGDGQIRKMFPSPLPVLPKHSQHSQQNLRHPREIVVIQSSIVSTPIW